VTEPDAPTDAATPAAPAVPATSVVPEPDARTDIDRHDTAPTDSAPPARAQRPTRSVKAMARALVPLVVVVVAAVWFFSPRGTHETRRADVGGDLAYAGKIAGVALPRPRGLDASWRAVQSKVTTPPNGTAGPVTVAVSYLTPDKVAATFAVSTSSLEQLLENQVGDSDEQGSTPIGSRKWQLLRDGDGRTVLAGTLGRTSVVIAGKGDRAELTVLADAVS
jgi:Protein of unknown function (DUF4245)